ncbi:polyamine deacetylase HDAC10 isoform X2 [Bombina bombina]|uniref:polyamine deacetylase HDAC10 isoform X2 n=1 Tax=Bombina bombina TaxID=8345 RepID=UPI00235A9A70|nr:polyamine deacetylase HDAC10 isoform X2 [Bombina bombina]
MASGTGLIYDQEMMNYKLLWDDPECAIEVPERLSASYERLLHYDLVKRCVQLPIREASEEEITLVHSNDYLEVVKSTQTMNEEELKKTSQKYIAAYFHQNSYRCAKLSLGGTLRLVDAVMSGEVRNGMALIRPPGHHSQRAESNGFCIFNNVAVAAEYAKKRYNLQRILIVDWDVHHGQGIQFIFEDDPSVLYFSWHRYEHKTFWPNLRESDYDAVGTGKGTGFTINLPWNKTGMRNADYVAAFFHVLLPLAFEFDPELVLVSSGYDSGVGDPEGRMCATPECFSHLTHLLMHLASGKLCVVLEGGYHLRSLAESVAMTVRTLLGDQLPILSGEMVPCHSALESMQNVRAAQTPYWKCLSHEGTKPVSDPSTMHQPTDDHAGAQQEFLDAAAVNDFLETHMKQILHPSPPVRTAAVVSEAHALVLPESMQVEKRAAAQEEIHHYSSCFHSELFQDENFICSLGKMLTLLKELVNKQIANGIMLSSDASLSAAIALQHVRSLGLPRVLYIAVGNLDTKPVVDNDGKTLLLDICSDLPAGYTNSKYQVSLKWNEGPGESSSFVYVLLRFILPLAYSYQPHFIIVAAGRNRTIGMKDMCLLTSMLQGLAQGRVVVILSEMETKLAEAVVSCLAGCSTAKEFGPYRSPSQESVCYLLEEINSLQKEWNMLQACVD